MPDEELDKLINSVSVVITVDRKVSVWRNLFDARSYATEMGAELIEDVEIQEREARRSN